MSNTDPTIPTRFLTSLNRHLRKHGLGDTVISIEMPRYGRPGALHACRYDTADLRMLVDWLRTLSGATVTVDAFSEKLDRTVHLHGAGALDDGTTVAVKVIAVVAATPEHTYQVLTKRHGRMRSLLSRGSLGTEGFPDMVEEAMAEFTHAALDAWPLPNVWLGVSVENQRWADIRIPALYDTPAAVRFLSCEPLLGPVDLGIGDPHRNHQYEHIGDYTLKCLDCSTEDNEVAWFRREPGADDLLHWVIAGGESGVGARPVDPAWIRALRDECQQAELPFLFKQWGGRTPKAGGRELDGRTWDEYPAVAAS